MSDTTDAAAFGPCHGMGGKWHRCNGPAAPFSVRFNGKPGDAYTFCQAAIDEVRRQAGDAGERVEFTALPVFPARGYIHGVMMARSAEIQRQWGA